MLKKVLVLVSMAAVVALLVAGLSGFGAPDASRVYASRLAGISGAGITGIQVQNLDQAASATITAEFYPQVEGEMKSFPQTAAAGAAANFYLPQLDGLADGAYAAIVNSDRQIAAIARTDWAQSLAAGTYSNVIPGLDVALPLVVKQYGGQCSLVSIQNTNTSASGTATVEIYQVGVADAKFTKDYTIRRGSSVTLQLCTDDDFETTIPTNFLGSMRVKSQDGVTKFGVQSFVNLTKTGQEKAVYAFEGVPADQAATTLYAPLFRKKQALSGGATGVTGISVVNTESTPVDVTVEYYPTVTAACTSGNMVSEAHSIDGNSSYVFYQGAADSPVPNGCYGSAKITATGKILAIVNDSVNKGGVNNTEAAAYNAVPADQAGNLVALPLFRSGHSKGYLFTGISAMNTGTDPATITLKATAADGTVLEGQPKMTATNILANQTVVFWPPDFTKTAGAPWNVVSAAYGSATIESTQPVVVIVNDTSRATDLSKKTDASTYLGIKIGQ